MSILPPIGWNLYVNTGGILVSNLATNMGFQTSRGHPSAPDAAIPPAILSQFERGFGSLGYGSSLVQKNYSYSDFLASQDSTIRNVQMLACAQLPASYRNACIAVTGQPQSPSPTHIQQYRGLGAPVLLEVGSKSVTQWKVTAKGNFDRLDTIPLAALDTIFDEHRGDWSPTRILNAKTLTLSAQLDFIDLGLMPALEGMIHDKLDQLLRRVQSQITSAYEDQFGQKPALEDLLPVIFSFLAAKVLVDRGNKPQWAKSDGTSVLEGVQSHYRNNLHARQISHPNSERFNDTAWNCINAGFSFQNLSVDDLAFVYEQTFVTKTTRKSYGTHSTPLYIAQHMVQQLPIQDLPELERRVLEPFSGHGIFLIAAMRRLRELLPSNLSDEDRHGYLQERLEGIEIDPFASEVSRLCLMLADYPNPNGWKITPKNVFDGDVLESALKPATIVLSNPPFEAFKERGTYRHVYKPAELLFRILQHPPKMFGIVLPITFTNGADYREANLKIAELYDDVEITALPDNVFSVARQETVLLTASHPHPSGRPLRIECRSLNREALLEFRTQGILPEPRVETRVRASDHHLPGDLWIPSGNDLWEALDQYPRLNTFAGIHRGIQWKRGVNDAQKFRAGGDCPEGWREGYWSPRGVMEQYSIGASGWINPDETNMVGQPMRYPWDKPKVMFCANASSSGLWRSMAVTDYSGALANQSFYLAWPKTPTLPAEVVCAIINSPVAAKWLSTHGDKRHNKGSTYDTIPVPELNPIEIDMFVLKVRQLEELLAADDAHSPRMETKVIELVSEIDAALLHAYRLPENLSNALIAEAAIAKRPLPIRDQTDVNWSDALERWDRDCKHRRYIVEYQGLVELSFARPLSAEERREIRRLEQLLDDSETRFYTDPDVQPELNMAAV